MSEYPARDLSRNQSKNPTDLDLGEFLDGEGQLGVMVGFEADGEWTHYRFTPRAARQIADSLNAWLDEHMGGPDES